MPSKNFTNFDVRSALLSGDYIVGYKEDGTTEFRATYKDLIEFLKPYLQELEFPQQLPITGSWSTFTVPNPEGASGSSWHSVYYWSANNKWYAVYHSGSKNNKGVSASGATPTTWSQITLPETNYWIQITGDNTYLYIIAESSNLYRSSNGTTWTKLTSFPSGIYWTKMKKLGNLLYASDPRVASQNYGSLDNGNASFQISGGVINDMAYDGSMWIATTNTLIVKTSTNGTTWNDLTVPNNYGSSWNNITYGNGMWVVWNPLSNKASVSRNNGGTSWTPIVLPAQTSYTEDSIIFYKNKFWLFSGLTVYYSDNLGTWGTMSLPVNLLSPAIGFGNNSIIMFGDRSTTSIISPTLV